MTVFEKWWSSIVRRRSGFGQDDSIKVTMTIGVFKKLAKRAHDDGFNCGIKVAPPHQDADLMKNFLGRYGK